MFKSNLTLKNKSYWQTYKPGEIPSVPQNPPQELLNSISSPILDVGTGDGVLAEELEKQGFDVYGIDIAENIIKENIKRITKVKYSIQSITTRTDFPDNFFDLIVFKFTMTNIHKDSWDNVAKEAYRILKPTGKVWVLEPLVSESYKKRYELAANFVKDKNCVYVFYDKDLAEKITSKSDLENAIKENKVSRVIKHYTIEELKKVFDKLEMTDNRVIKVTSPSGYTINTFEGVFVKR